MRSSTTESSTSQNGAMPDNPASEKQTTETEISSRKIHGIRWALVVTAILSSTFLFALDNTVVANIQPAIVEEFGQIGKMAWLGVAFVLGSSATVLSWLQIFNQFNIKWLYILSIFLFEGGSAICGAAQSMDMLIVGRVICGIGGVGQYVGVMCFLPSLTTVTERPIYIGGIGLTWGLGTVLGPIISGAFTDSSAGWRWAFYINLCIGGLFAPVYLFLLPSIDPQANRKTVKERFSAIDSVGSVLLMGAFTAGVIGIDFGGVTLPWDSAGTIVALVISGITFVAAGFQQTYCIFTTPATRLFPVQLVSFRQPLMVILFIEGVCAATCVLVPTYMIPLYFQFTASDTALDSGVRLLPFVCLLVFACIINGVLLPKLGYYMPWYTLSGVLALVGSALMYTVKAETHVSAVYGFSALLGLGAGMFLQMGHSVAQASVSIENIPGAVAFTTCAQLNGLTFALVIAECVFLNGAQNRITKILPKEPKADIQGAILGVGSTLVASLDSETQGKVIAAIVDAMSKTYILTIVAGVLALLLSFAMKRERLFMTAAVAA